MNRMKKASEMSEALLFMKYLELRFNPDHAVVR